MDQTGLSTEVTASRVPHGRFTLGRIVLAVAVSAGISAVLAAFHVPPLPGFVYGTAAGLAIVGITALAKDHRDLCSALAAITSGLLVGVPLVQDSCTPVGLFFGPMMGFAIRLATRRVAQTRSIDEFGTGVDPIVSVSHCLG